jgi:uncharacterized repeat protein (TIGR03803 family)
MSYSRDPRFKTHLALMCLLVLALASPASAESKEKVLYSFQGGTSDGIYPPGGVVFDKSGNLYGATTDGGGKCAGPGDCGTVFQLAPPAEKGGPWTETVLYIFKGNGSGDGATPGGSVIIDSAGNLYGTTAYGGTGDCVLLGTKVGCGTVYELSPPAQKGGAWTETVLYSFPTAERGYLPNGNLVFDGAGNLYGATMFGGGYGTTCDDFYQYCGEVFELSPPAKNGGGEWTEKVLHGFKGGMKGEMSSDGALPNGGLVIDSKGAIYGTTYNGGNDAGECSGGVEAIGCGTVFKLTPPVKKGGAWTEKVIFRFNVQDGANPYAGVVFDKKGRLYCTTLAGGGGRYPSGAAVQLVPEGDAWVEHVLYSFQDNSDGSEPRSSLTFDSKGALYGTASGGGAAGGGTLFRLRPQAGGSWAFKSLYQFQVRPDGDYPMGDLVLDSSGNFYGTTQYGGSGQACANYGCGTVFEFSP